MPPEFQPSSEDLARYLEQRGELSKPWNLQMLRLKKLKEAKDSMDPQLYLEKVQEAPSISNSSFTAHGSINAVQTIQPK